MFNYTFTHQGDTIITGCTKRTSHTVNGSSLLLWKERSSNRESTQSLPEASAGAAKDSWWTNCYLDLVFLLRWLFLARGCRRAASCSEGSQKIVSATSVPTTTTRPGKLNLLRV